MAYCSLEELDLCRGFHVPSIEAWKNANITDVSPDGRFVAIAGRSRTIHILDVDRRCYSKRYMITLSEQAESDLNRALHAEDKTSRLTCHIVSIRYHRSGRYLLVLLNKLVVILDLEEGRIAYDYLIRDESVKSNFEDADFIIASSDSKYYALAMTKSLHRVSWGEEDEDETIFHDFNECFNEFTRPQTNYSPEREITAFKCAPHDADLLAMGTTYGFVYIISLSGKEVMKRIEFESRSGICCLVWSPSLKRSGLRNYENRPAPDRLVAIGSYDDVIELHDPIKPGKPYARLDMRWPIGLKCPPNDFSFLKDKESKKKRHYQNLVWLDCEGELTRIYFASGMKQPLRTWNLDILPTTSREEHETVTAISGPRSESATLRMIGVSTADNARIFTFGINGQCAAYSLNVNREAVCAFTFTTLSNDCKCAEIAGDRLFLGTGLYSNHHNVFAIDVGKDQSADFDPDLPYNGRSLFQWPPDAQVTCLTAHEELVVAATTRKPWAAGSPTAPGLLVAFLNKRDENANYQLFCRTMMIQPREKLEAIAQLRFGPSLSNGRSSFQPADTACDLYALVELEIKEEQPRGKRRGHQQTQQARKEWKIVIIKSEERGYSFKEVFDSRMVVEKPQCFEWSDMVSHRTLAVSHAAKLEVDAGPHHRTKEPPKQKAAVSFYDVRETVARGSTSTRARPQAFAGQGRSGDAQNRLQLHYRNRIVLHDYFGRIDALAWNADCSLLAVTAKFEVHIIDVHTCQIVRTLGGASRNDIYRDVAFCPTDDDYLITTMNCGVALWNREQNVRTPHRVFDEHHSTNVIRCFFASKPDVIISVSKNNIYSILCPELKPTPEKLTSTGAHLKNVVGMENGISPSYYSRAASAIEQGGDGPPSYFQPPSTTTNRIRPTVPHFPHNSQDMRRSNEAAPFPSGRSNESAAFPTIAAAFSNGNNTAAAAASSQDCRNRTYFPSNTEAVQYSTSIYGSGQPTPSSYIDDSPYIAGSFQAAAAVSHSNDPWPSPTAKVSVLPPKFPPQLATDIPSYSPMIGGEGSANGSIFSDGGSVSKQDVAKESPTRSWKSEDLTDDEMEGGEEMKGDGKYNCWYMESNVLDDRRADLVAMILESACGVQNEGSRLEKTKSPFVWLLDQDRRILMEISYSMMLKTKDNLRSYFYALTSGLMPKLVERFVSGGAASMSTADAVFFTALQGAPQFQTRYAQQLERVKEHFTAVLLHLAAGSPEDAIEQLRLTKTPTTKAVLQDAMLVARLQLEEGHEIIAKLAEEWYGMAEGVEEQVALLVFMERPKEVISKLFDSWTFSSERLWLALLRYAALKLNEDSEKPKAVNDDEKLNVNSEKLNENGEEKLNENGEEKLNENGENLNENGEEKHNENGEKLNENGEKENENSETQIKNAAELNEDDVLSLALQNVPLLVQSEGISCVRIDKAFHTVLLDANQKEISSILSFVMKLYKPIYDAYLHSASQKPTFDDSKISLTAFHVLRGEAAADLELLQTMIEKIQQQNSFKIFSILPNPLKERALCTAFYCAALTLAISLKQYETAQEMLVKLICKDKRCFSRKSEGKLRCSMVNALLPYFSDTLRLALAGEDESASEFSESLVEFRKEADALVKCLRFYVHDFGALVSLLQCNTNLPNNCVLAQENFCECLPHVVELSENGSDLLNAKVFTAKVARVASLVKRNEEKFCEECKRLLTSEKKPLSCTSPTSSGSGRKTVAQSLQQSLLSSPQESVSDMQE